MPVANQRDTYQKYLPPYIETDKLVMTFSHVRYLFPTMQLLLAMHKRLSAAVEIKNYAKILNTIEALEPYRINMKVSDSKRQTIATDV